MARFLLYYLETRANAEAIEDDCRAVAGRATKCLVYVIARAERVTDATADSRR